MKIKLYQTSGNQVGGIEHDTRHNKLKIEIADADLQNKVLAVLKLVQFELTRSWDLEITQPAPEILEVGKITRSKFSLLIEKLMVYLGLVLDQD